VNSVSIPNRLFSFYGQFFKQLIASYELENSNYDGIYLFCVKYLPNIQPNEIRESDLSIRNFISRVGRKFSIFISFSLLQSAILQVSIKFFKNKLFMCNNKGKFIVFEKLDCNLQQYP
jgi:hypothetical protein